MFVEKSDFRVSKLAKGAMLRVPETSPRYAHFLMSGAASVTTQMSEGRYATCGLLTGGDLLETNALLGINAPNVQITVLVPAEAVRVPYHALRRAFDEDVAFRGLIMSQLADQMIELRQNVICHQFHQIDVRLARFLLTLQDRCDTPSIPLTQEDVAQQLGSRRTSVALQAGKFRRQGLLAFRRGRILISDRPGLEAVACECYRATFRHAAVPENVREDTEARSAPRPILQTVPQDLF